MEASQLEFSPSTPVDLQLSPISGSFLIEECIRSTYYTAGHHMGRRRFRRGRAVAQLPRLLNTSGKRSFVSENSHSGKTCRPLDAQYFTAPLFSCSLDAFLNHPQLRRQRQRQRRRRRRRRCCRRPVLLEATSRRRLPSPPPENEGESGEDG